MPEARNIINRRDKPAESRPIRSAPAGPHNTLHKQPHPPTSGLPFKPFPRNILSWARSRDLETFLLRRFRLNHLLSFHAAMRLIAFPRMIF